MAQVMVGGGFTEAELDWCKQNYQAVPEAALTLKLYKATRQRPDDKPIHEAFDKAVDDLRKVHPRPRNLVDRMYAYIMPTLNGPGESIPGTQEGPFVKLLMGCDMVRMRSMESTVELIEKQFRTRLSLYRFKFDRVITDEELATVQSLNEARMRCLEVFTFVGVFPGTGDETILAMPTPTGHVPMFHGHVADIRAMLPYAQKVRQRAPTELRRFVRAEKVDRKLM